MAARASRPSHPSVSGPSTSFANLHGGTLAIQGPPGSGKTYTGARMICASGEAGQARRRHGHRPQGHPESASTRWRPRPRRQETCDSTRSQSPRNRRIRVRTAFAISKRTRTRSTRIASRSVQVAGRHGLDVVARGVRQRRRRALRRRGRRRCRSPTRSPFPAPPRTWCSSAIRSSSSSRRRAAIPTASASRRSTTSSDGHKTMPAGSRAVSAADVAPARRDLRLHIGSVLRKQARVSGRPRATGVDGGRSLRRLGSGARRGRARGLPERVGRRSGCRVGIVEELLRPGVALDRRGGRGAAVSGPKTSWSSRRTTRMSVVFRNASRRCGPRRHRGPVSGPGSAGRDLLDGDVAARGCPARHGVSLQPQSPQRRHVAREVRVHPGRQPAIFSSPSAARPRQMQFANALARFREMARRSSSTWPA